MGIARTDDKRLSRALENAAVLYWDRGSRLVIMSDCHRGDGSGADNFAANRNLYVAALTRYYREGYAYIEIGDGDELWENRRFGTIWQAHEDVFLLLQKFHAAGRLTVLFGNHDMVKRRPDWAEQRCIRPDPATGGTRPVFPGLRVHESVLLRERHPPCRQILLIHGHQVDFLNDRLWRLSRMLVRYLWRPLELAGIRDPTSASKSEPRRLSVEARLGRWAEAHCQIVVAGHTHRPVFAAEGSPPYFNDGSCVRPRLITALEIEDGAIRLVRWVYKVRGNGSIYIGREVVDGPRPLNDCFPDGAPCGFPPSRGAETQVKTTP